MASGLITLNSEKDVILFNPAAEEIFGLPTGAAIGQKITNILPFLESYLDTETEDSGPIMKKGPSFIDVTYHGKNGQEKFLRFSISPLEPSGAGQKGSILFFQDVTEIKNIEEEMKRVEGLALVGELAAGIAHEIRNPMASISGSIQILKEGLDHDVVNNRLMDIILREITRLNNLVNDFLIFAKPFKASFQEFDLHQLIMESLELFRNMGHWTDKIRVETHWGGEIRLESDPEQIKQVLWNLFLNASEAMPHGGSLHIRTEVVNGRGDPHKNKKTVKITVRDTGQGFSPRAISQLFTPFFTTKEGGSGLGLATVKRIVEGLKGRVYGKNHPEGGAEVTIVLRSSPFPIT
jgi:two-component system sensor histidine kinase PilS (NtrC family)